MLIKILTIVFVSVAIVLTIVSFLLNLFVSKVLKNREVLLARTIVALLTIQFILGILANLFAQIPTKEPWLVFHEFGYISAHTANATILLILSIIFIQRTIKSKDNPASGIIGLIGIIVAFTSGVIYLLTLAKIISSRLPWHLDLSPLY